MGNYTYSFMDRWTTPGSVLPLTPYENWQYEKYGNFYKEKDTEPISNLDEVQELQVKIYLND